MGSCSEPTPKKLSGFDFWQKTLNSAKYVLAPMVDQSELAWRILSRRYGAELCYTPMFLASVFNRDATYRKSVMASCAEDRPLIVQFSANSPESLLKAAKFVENDCDAIDLNLGCPQSIAKRGHYGAFLQDDWNLLHNMISLCHKELKVPITCKIRIFEDVEKTVKYAQMLENAGAQLLTVHGRTKEQKGINTGLASWKHIAAVRKSVKIPVFANGNIQYFDDIARCMSETGVCGVMVAEGSLHNPAIFTQDLHPVWKLAKEYLDIVDLYPCPIAFVRGHLFKLLHHVLCMHPNMRDVLGVCKNMQDVRSVVGELEKLCLTDVLKHKENNLQSIQMDKLQTISTPYWICQPYVRPDGIRNQQKRTLSAATIDGEDEEEEDEKVVGQVGGGNPDSRVEVLSRNKLKKLKRNCNKSFEPKKLKFEICVCGHPKGLKCIFSKCKICCKVLVFKLMQDCPGHKIFIKNKKHGNQHNDEDIKDTKLNQYVNSNNGVFVVEHSDEGGSGRCSGGSCSSSSNSCGGEALKTFAPNVVDIDSSDLT